MGYLVLSMLAIAAVVSVSKADGTLKVPGEYIHGYSVDEDALTDDIGVFHEPVTCVPNSNFKKNCNYCMCASTGTSYACTLKACLPGLYNEDGTMKSQDSNVVETLRRKRQILINPYYRVACVPGTFVKYYCNDCHCSTDGTYNACTWAVCPPGVYNPDGTRINAGTVNVVTTAPNVNVAGPIICQPGVTFNKYCNTCRCSLDGRNVRCTQITCPPGVFNENGTIKITLRR